MEINISVVIVTWNSEKDIEECLLSLRSQSYKDFNVILVDNASSDKTLEIVENNFPDVIVLAQDKNLFLTRANNLGISYAIQNYNPEFVMVLNPDTKLDSNLLETLLSSMKDENIGAVGPKVKFYKNKNEGLINSAGLNFDGFSQAYDIGFEEEDSAQYDSPKEVFGVTGACILYRVKMLNEIGLYWPRIKLYLDEVELFIRAHNAGWKVLYNPKTTLWHKYMASTDQLKVEKIGKVKKDAWLWIALRHYPLKNKFAMVKNYLF
jgi:GT2 family glycosyltransferase